MNDLIDRNELKELWCSGCNCTDCGTCVDMKYIDSVKSANMDKVYIITAGTYSAYHIVAVFTKQEEAEKFRDTYNSRLGRFSEECRIEEFPVGADMSLAGKRLYCAYEGAHNGIYAYDTCENIFEYANEIGVVKDNGVHLECYVSVDMNCDEPEEYALKVAADLFAEYMARKEGIT